MPRKAAPKNTKRFEKSVKAIVREEIAEELEHKVCQVDYGNVLMKRSIPFGNVTNGAGNFFKLMPEIQQSTTGLAGAKYNERIGNQLTLKELDIHGYLSYNGVFNPQSLPNDGKLAVRIMILRAKEINAQGLAFEEMPTDTLIRSGSFGGTGGPTPYDGFVLDSFREINRDTFAVRYDKVHYINAPIASPGLTSPDLAFVPSGLRLFRHKLKFGKTGLKIKYSEKDDVEPNNFPYFMVIGYSSMSGSGQPSDDLVRMSVSINGKYTDA